MPRSPKPKDLRQNTERLDMGRIPDELSSAEIPKPPPGLLKPTRESWARYWSSPVRRALVPSLDMDTLERLWTLYDERARAYREVRRARVVKGSQGQDRPSGFYAILTRLDAEIRQLEDRVAKHMRSRLVLGLVVGDEPGDGDADDEPEAAPDDFDDGPDPRLYVVDRRAG